MCNTIQGYSVQFRKHESHSWQTVFESGNAIMYEALNALPSMVRNSGRGYFRIVKHISNGDYEVMFTAELPHRPQLFRSNSND